MCSKINAKLAEIRKDFVISIAKNTLSNNEDIEKSIMFNTILLSWFENVDSNEDFENKYNALKKLSSDVKVSSLFDIVISLNGNYSHDNLLIEKCLDLYSEIKKDSDLKNIFLKCGYTIPNSFSKRERYEDLSIKENVSVFYNFEKKLDEIKSMCFDKEKK